MRCIKCGNQIDEDSKFCSKCGEPFVIKKFNEKIKERGVLLTGWLIFIFVVNLGVGLHYLFGQNSLTELLPYVPAWIFSLYAVIGLSNSAFATFLFFWKRWAFFAICGITIITFILNVILFDSLSINILSLFGLIATPTILYLIMRPKWDLFQ